jgi:hypothetical protein
VTQPRGEHGEWAASLPLAAAAGLASLRFLRGTAALIVEEVIWLRGQKLSAADELRLRQVPDLERFQVTEQGELLPMGSLLPCGHLPSGTWQKLKDFLQPQLPPLRIVADTLPQLTLSLVRDTQQRDVAAVLTTINVWEEYALSAPQVRLTPLKFAMNAERKVLIVGTPLPPLTGEWFWEAGGIFIAAGWCWSPAVEPVIVRRLLQLSDDDVGLWHANGQWELIRRNDCVAARRAAVRASVTGATKS